MNKGNPMRAGIVVAIIALATVLSAGCNSPSSGGKALTRSEADAFRATPGPPPPEAIAAMARGKAATPPPPPPTAAPK